MNDFYSIRGQHAAVLEPVIRLRRTHEEREAAIEALTAQHAAEEARRRESHERCIGVPLMREAKRVCIECGREFLAVSQVHNYRFRTTCGVECQALRTQRNIANRRRDRRARWI